MKKLICLATLFCLLFPAGMQGQPSPRMLAIRDVNLIPMDKERVLSHQTILIQDGIIKTIGDFPKVPIPANARVIEGQGKYLIPGLFDMHTHFFYEQGDNKNTCAAELKLMLANGLTTARFLCGDSLYLEIRRAAWAGKFPAPVMIISSPQFVGAWPWPGKVFAFVCKEPAEAVEAVRKSKSSGYDEIKITFMVKRDVYDAIIQTAKEIGIPVTGHVGPLVKLPAALAARQQIEHMDEFIDMLLPDTSYNHGQSVSDMNLWRIAAWKTVPYLDERKIPALVEQVKAAHIFVSPTNYFFISCFGEAMTEQKAKARPDYEFIPETIKNENWKTRAHYLSMLPDSASREKFIRIRLEMTRQLWKAGVPLMAGSDTPEWFLVQGFTLHDELETFVRAGLSPFAALQTATTNPAIYLGWEKKCGSIKEGMESRLVLLNKNPLEDIRNSRSIEAVFSGDQFYDKATLLQMLKDAKAELK